MRAILRSHRRPLRPIPLLAPRGLLLASQRSARVTDRVATVEQLYNFFLDRCSLRVRARDQPDGLVDHGPLPAQERPDLPAQIHGNNRLELTWTILPRSLVSVPVRGHGPDPEPDHRQGGRPACPDRRARLPVGSGATVSTNPDGGAGPEGSAHRRHPDRDRPTAPPVGSGSAPPRDPPVLRAPRAVQADNDPKGALAIRHDLRQGRDVPGTNCPQPTTGCSTPGMIFNVQALPTDQYDQWFLVAAGGRGAGT